MAMSGFFHFVFTHTSRDAPLSPAYCLVFAPLMFILIRVYWKENVSLVRTEGEEERKMGETVDEKEGEGKERTEKDND